MDECGLRKFENGKDDTRENGYARGEEGDRVKWATKGSTGEMRKYVVALTGRLMD